MLLKFYSRELLEVSITIVSTVFMSVYFIIQKDVLNQEKSREISVITKVYK